MVNKNLSENRGAAEFVQVARMAVLQETFGRRPSETVN
jgi:hypothetical protein